MKALLHGVNVFSQFEKPIRNLNYQTLLALVSAASISTSLVSWLEPSCDGNNQEVERRKADLVQSYINLVQAGIPLTGALLAGDCDFPVVESLAVDPNGFGFTRLVGGTSVDLDSRTTEGVPDGAVQLVLSGNGGISYYELTTATAATNSPEIIRPVDYSATNTRNWILRRHNDPGYRDFDITATVGAVAINKLQGNAIIAAGASSVAITNTFVGATPAADTLAWANLGAVDGTALYVKAVVLTANTITIHVNTNATANLLVYWQIAKKIGNV